MTIGILFVIGFAVAALVFAGIVIARVLKKEKKIGANNEANDNSIPLKPRETYRVAILISLIIGLLVAVIVYFVGMT